MRFGVLTIQMLLLTLVGVLSALISGFLFYSIHKSILEQVQATVLEQEATFIQSLSIQTLDSLDTDCNECITQNTISSHLFKKDIFPYSMYVWDMKGILLKFGGGTHLPPNFIDENSFASFLDKHALSGVDRFRVDNFNDYKAGLTNTAIYFHVSYLPDANLFWGVGGPLLTISARINALSNYQVIFEQSLFLPALGTLLLAIALCCFLSFLHIRHAYSRPLHNLLHGYTGTHSIGRRVFTNEMQEIGTGIKSLQSQLDASLARETVCQKKLGEITQHYEELKDGYFYRLRETQEFLSNKNSSELRQEREKLYLLIQEILLKNTQADPPREALQKRLECLLEVLSSNFEMKDTLSSDSWLSNFAMNYQIPDNMQPLITNLKSNVKLCINSKSLESILCELLDNAYQHCSTNSIVSLNCLNSDGGIDISVHNQGNGLEPDTNSLVLYPFFSTQAGHSGLGLTCARMNADKLGCALRIYSETDKGFSAVLHIPDALFAPESGVQVD